MGFFEKIKQGLRKTRESIGAMLSSIFSGRRVKKRKGEVIMPATIKCKDSIKKEIKSYLLEELGELMEQIRESFYEVSIEESADGLEIEFPIGEIYGYSSDYVQSVAYVFANLKKKYTDISIYGIAYEYETITAGTFGPLFYCQEEDTELNITFEWQECACCGEIIETEACYNSSQWNFEEGNLMCLCCPTCMLEYSLSKEYGEVEPNGSFSEEEIDIIYNSEDEEKVLKKLLWNRISTHLEEYMEDFVKNKERIRALVNRADITDSEKEVLMTILNG